MQMLKKHRKSALILALVATAVYAASDYGSFLGVLQARESSGNQYAKTPTGTFIGLYQMGPGALKDTGYKNAKGQWTGKNGINSEADFLANADVQTQAVTEYHKKLQGYLRAEGAYQYIGQEVNGVVVTESGLIAASHLVGAGGVSQWMKTGVMPQDGNGTKALEYMKLGNGYETPRTGVTPDLGYGKQVLSEYKSSGNVNNYVPKSMPQTGFFQRLQNAMRIQPANLGKDIGAPGTQCASLEYMAPACYIRDPCNLRCTGKAAEQNADEMHFDP